MDMETMMEGKRVVIAGARKFEEFSTLIEKQGGIPVVRSMQGTVYLAENAVEKDLRQLVVNGADWMVFITGVGTDTLFAQAEKLGIHSEFLRIVEQSKIAARGYKTFAALKKMGIKPDVVDDDGTNRGLIKALEDMDFRDQRVVVQLHGEPAPGLIRFLEGRGAIVTQLLPYQHIPPDSHVVEMLCQELTDGKVDAVCFTTGLQVRNLFHYAKQHGYYHLIKRAFSDKVVAVSIGKLTAEPLVEEGIERILIPESERMGAMIYELRNYYSFLGF
jgi:uroporphyrinogen-III synthase